MGTKASEIKLCSIVKAELWYGALRSKRAPVVIKALTAFFAPYESFPFDDAAVAEYGAIRTQLAAEGALIGPNDLMIAAICRRRGLTLVTHNVREFSRIAGLPVEDWE